MYTIGDVTKKVIDRAESWNINIGAVCDSVSPKGTVVKLLSTGHVTAVTAATDEPFGVLSVGARATGDLATVSTQFQMMTRALAKGGTIAIGDKLSAAEVDTGSEKLMEFSKNAAGQYVAGIALSGGAAGAEILVGLLRVPVLTPAAP